MHKDVLNIFYLILCAVTYIDTEFIAECRVLLDTFRYFQTASVCNAFYRESVILRHLTKSRMLIVKSGCQCHALYRKFLILR